MPRRSGNSPNRWRDAIFIGLLMCAAHAGALWWLTTTFARGPALITPPAIVGVLVTEAPEVSKPEPLPIAPDVSPKPRSKPLVRPKPVPVPPIHDAPPSERAVTAPPEPPAESEDKATHEPEAVPPPAASAPPAPRMADPPPQPVAPPRADASFLNNPAPRYPVASKRRREQGRVLMDVFILADGSVGDIKLKRSSGYPLLDEAALDAVRRWRYVPAKRGQMPIDYWHVQPLDFKLDL